MKWLQRFDKISALLLFFIFLLVVMFFYLYTVEKDVKYYTIENIGSGVDVITSNTWDIKINPENDIQTQLDNLKIILKDNKVQLYIDLRYGDRVFWK